MRGYWCLSGYGKYTMGRQVVQRRSSLSKLGFYIETVEEIVKIHESSTSFTSTIWVMRPVDASERKCGDRRTCHQPVTRRECTVRQVVRTWQSRSSRAVINARCRRGVWVVCIGRMVSREQATLIVNKVEFCKLP